VAHCFLLNITARMAPLADVESREVRSLGAAAELLLEEFVPHPALPFAREIVLQTAFPLGSVRGSDDDEIAVVRAVVKLFRTASEGVADLSLPASASGWHARLVAAVFQNLDLLYDSGFPHADAIAGAVLEAVWEEDQRATRETVAVEPEGHAEEHRDESR
jgi:hypothetical protein